MEQTNISIHKTNVKITHISPSTEGDTDLNSTVILVKKDEPEVIAMWKENRNFLSEKNKGGQILPNKLQWLDGKFYFAFCTILEGKVVDYAFSIIPIGKCGNKGIETTDASEVRTNNDSELNGDRFGRDLILTPTMLGIAIPTRKNSKNGLSFVSSFEIIKKHNTTLVFLTVFNYVLLLQFQDTETDLKWKVIFTKQFPEKGLLRILYYEKVNEIDHKFYLTSKPDGFLTFHLNGKDNQINFVERNITQSPTCKNEQITSVMKLYVSAAPWILFFDNNLNKIFLLKKRKLKKVRNVQMDMTKFKQFFPMSFAQNLFILTEEVSIEGEILLKLWSVPVESSDVNKTQPSDTEITPSLLQTLKISKEINKLGVYNYTILNQKFFIANFYEQNEFLLFKICQNEGGIKVEHVYQLNFPELYAFAFNYQFYSQDEVLVLTMYQENEFVSYKINLPSVGIGKLELANAIVEDPTPKSGLIQHDLSTSKILKPESIPSNKSKQTKNSKLNSSLLGQNINSLNEAKKSLGDSLLASLEDKFEKIVTTKLNTFADTLNHKLTNVFSFIKRQTEDFEDIRKKNSENMNLISELLIKNRNTNVFTPSATNTPVTGSYTVKTPLRPNSQPFYANQGFNRSQMWTNPSSNDQKGANFNRGGNYQASNPENKNNFPFAAGNYPVFNNLMQSYALSMMNMQQMFANPSNLPNGNANNFSNFTQNVQNDTKYKEDEIAELRNIASLKSNEIKSKNENEENITLDLNYDKNNSEKDIINYSSDISSGNLESDINIHLALEQKENAFGNDVERKGGNTTKANEMETVNKKNIEEKKHQQGKKQKQGKKSKKMNGKNIKKK